MLSHEWSYPSILLHLSLSLAYDYRHSTSDITLKHMGISMNPLRADNITTKQQWHQSRVHIILNLIYILSELHDMNQQTHGSCTGFAPLVHIIGGVNVHVHPCTLVNFTVTSSWARWYLKITGASIVHSTVCSGVDQRKRQSAASLALLRGIHRWPVNSPHKGPVTWKLFSFDVIMFKKSWLLYTIGCTIIMTEYLYFVISDKVHKTNQHSKKLVYKQCEHNFKFQTRVTWQQDS